MPRDGAVKETKLETAAAAAETAAAAVARLGLQRAPALPAGTSGCRPGPVEFAALNCVRRTGAAEAGSFSNSLGVIKAPDDFRKPSAQIVLIND